MKTFFGILLFVAQLPGIALAQQRDVTVTVYQSNLALVREIRSLQLQTGVTEVEFIDVPARIDPTSVYFVSLTAPDDLRIVEQNFEYDLVGADKLLQKHIDRNVILETKDGTTYSGLLLSASAKETILKDSQGQVKIVTQANVENITFPEPVENLITKPTLVWKLSNSRNGKHETEIGYLTRGIRWHAEYVGIANEDDTSLDIGGWVSLDNKSGASFENARLKLVAGDVNLASSVRLQRTEALMAADAAPAFQEKPFFEYHLYTLQDRTTVANNQVKQISLFEPTDVITEKKYVYDQKRDKSKVGVFLNFENSKKSGLGKPLPRGKVRLYKRDDDDALVFLGEDNIDHTPENETVRVFSGFAFDIVAERTQKERKALGKTSWDEGWEIELRNSKDTAVSVKIIEHFNNGWEIIAHSQAYEVRDANTITFDLDVPGKNRSAISYTVRYHRN